MNPYINPSMQSQDLGGLNPVYQNMAAQQQNENQVAQQGQLLTQQAGQVGQQNGSMNGAAMAAALRKNKPTDPNAPQGASMGDQMANYFGTQQTPQNQAEIQQLGSNTWNPMSNYNTGANGWGSYGE